MMSITDVGYDVNQSSARHFYFHLVTQFAIQQRARQRRIDADVMLRTIEFVWTDNPVGDGLPVFVLEHYRGAEIYDFRVCRFLRDDFEIR